MGFGVPLATWFRQDLRSYLVDHIASSTSRIAAYVDPGGVARMLAAHLANKADHEHELWALLTLEIWLRTLPRLSRPWQEPAAPDQLGVAPLARAASSSP
jgi:asparagine synthase (glutamine-hydrolysing)